MEQFNKYYRPIQGRQFAGVLAAVARETHMSVNALRVIAVLATLMTAGHAALAYLIAWAILPSEEKVHPTL